MRRVMVAVAVVISLAAVMAQAGFAGSGNISADVQTWFVQHGYNGQAVSSAHCDKVQKTKAYICTLWTGGGGFTGGRVLVLATVVSKKPLDVTYRQWCYGG